tara:strand:- start:286 stop:969 length:684 start_codon:yes stop_codon:yes gene_type:complete
MFRIYKNIILLLFLILPTISSAHVEHYEQLNEIKFDIYRNSKHIGSHVFSFEKEDNKLKVHSEINFQIKKLGVVLYKYKVKGTEVYENGKLVKFSSKTNQNGKEKYANIDLKEDELIIDGSSYKGKAPLDYLIGTWWNHSLIKAPAQISAVSGRIIHQKVTFIGKEKIIIGDNTYDTLHFNFSSTDTKLSKDKKLNTDVWYDEETLYWIKAAFKKKGEWEYKLISID